jgi:putative endonuclease
MKSASTRECGDRWEREAEAYLGRIGWRVIARQVRYRTGEIDLVAEESVGAVERILVFVEVRYRASGALIPASESVGPRKILRLNRAIKLYLSTYRGGAEGIRVDLIAFEGGVLTHLRNITGS